MCARPTPVPESLPSPVGASPRLVPVPCSPSGRYQTASAVVSDASSSAVASTPLRLRLVPQPPRASTARPGSPRARTVALGPTHFHPREVGPALPGRRVVPAPAASLSSLARSPPPPAPLQASSRTPPLLRERCVCFCTCVNRVRHRAPQDRGPGWFTAESAALRVEIWGEGTRELLTCVAVGTACARHRAPLGIQNLGPTLQRSEFV